MIVQGREIEFSLNHSSCLSLASASLLVNHEKEHLGSYRFEFKPALMEVTKKEYSSKSSAKNKPIISNNCE